MHDPNTVAFEIRYPWWTHRPGENPVWPDGYRSHFITIWHVDPETDGTDNSCWRRKPRGREKALLDAIREPIWDLETVIGNEPVYGSDLYPSIDQRGALGTPFEQLRHTVYGWTRKPGRPWRWHFWHWRIQIHPLQHFKRWVFSRCNKCGGRFRWGEIPVGPWAGTGPLWFRSEEAWHTDCRKQVSR